MDNPTSKDVSATCYQSWHNSEKSKKKIELAVCLKVLHSMNSMIIIRKLKTLVLPVTNVNDIEIPPKIKKLFERR